MTAALQASAFIAWQLQDVSNMCWQHHDLSSLQSPAGHMFSTSPASKTLTPVWLVVPQVAKMLTNWV